MSSKMGLTEQDSASCGPRDLKTPGDPAWCWQTVSVLQTMWKSIDLDLERYLGAWEDAEKHKIWEKIPYENPYGTKEAMLVDLALGDDARARARVAAQAAMPGRPLRRNGERGKSFDIRQSFPPAGGNKSEYLTARIARDRPDIWERMKRGEFKSVAEAAREAGIFRPAPKRVDVTGNLDRVARSILKILGTTEFERFLAAGQDVLTEVETEALDG